MKKKVVAGILCTAIVLGGVLAFFLTRNSEKDVSVERVETKDITKSIDVTGEVEPIMVFTAISETGGMVKELKVKAGDKVSAGDVLFTLDASEVEKMLADAKSSLAALQKNVQPVFNTQGNELDALQRAKIALALAQTTGYDLESFNGAISDVDISNMKEVFSQVQGLDSQSTTALAEQARLIGEATQNVAQLQAQMDRCRFTSSVDGTVLQCNIQQGGALLPGVPAMIVGNTDQLQVKAAVNERDLQSLAVGQPAMILNEATNVLWHAQIKSIPAMATRIQGMYGSETVGEVVIEPQGGFWALPGMSVGVSIILGQSPSVPAVPIESIVYEDAGAYVYVVRDGKAVKTSVRVGMSDSFYTEVNGVNAGELVVMSPEKTLMDGDRVRAID